MKTNEFWRPVPGFPNYEVSDHGRVRRATSGMGATKGKVLKPSLSRGYPFVVLRRDGRSHTRQVHRLVAMAFIPNPDGLPEVLHRDNDKGNTHVSNFRWGTHAENCADAGRDGLLGGGNKKKTNCGNCGRQYDGVKDGRRYCIECRRARGRRSYHRRKGERVA